jgi:hypothetical protein
METSRLITPQDGKRHAFHPYVLTSCPPQYRCICGFGPKRFDDLKKHVVDSERDRENEEMQAAMRQANGVE